VDGIRTIRAGAQPPQPRYIEPFTPAPLPRSNSRPPFAQVRVHTPSRGGAASQPTWLSTHARDRPPQAATTRDSRPGLLLFWVSVQRQWTRALLVHPFDIEWDPLSLRPKLRPGIARERAPTLRRRGTPLLSQQHGHILGCSPTAPDPRPPPLYPAYHFCRSSWKRHPPGTQVCWFKRRTFTRMTTRSSTSLDRQCTAKSSA